LSREYNEKCNICIFKDWWWIGESDNEVYLDKIVDSKVKWLKFRKVNSQTNWRIR
jgi:hypothetical protein